MSWGELQLRWAQQILAVFESVGGQDVILCPGSRSTPLVLAATLSNLRLTSIVDERSAAFYALGQARVTGVPSLLVCTSGSAVAHTLPAVIEARESGIPLIIISANRPPEVQDVGASQTTPQLSILASHTLESVQLGLPDVTEERLRAMGSRVARLFSIALQGPGPVHLDTPFRKPLEPASWPPVHEPLATIPRAAALVRQPDAASIHLLSQRVQNASSGVILLGPLGTGQVVREELAQTVRELAARTGFTLLAESTSGLRDGTRETRTGQPFRRVDAFDYLLKNRLFRGASAVDVILQIGPSPTSSATNDWVRLHRDHTWHAVFASVGWHDPQHAVDLVVNADLQVTLEALIDALPPTPGATPLQQWEAGDQVVWDVLLSHALEHGDALNTPNLVRTLATLLPQGGHLFVGNSLPVRALDSFAPHLPQSVGVVSQRGVAGIDGCIAGAQGVASVTPGRPTTLLLGDIATLHDIGSLAMASAQAQSPLVLLVIDNGGGRIFDFLPIQQLQGQPDPLPFFHTTPTVDLARIIAGFDIAVTEPQTVGELQSAIVDAWETVGTSAIVVRISEDAETQQALARQINQTLTHWFNAES